MNIEHARPLDTGARFRIVHRSGSQGAFGCARAQLVALLIGIAFLSVFADMVKTVQFGVLQLAPPAVVALFALVPTGTAA